MRIANQLGAYQKEHKLKTASETYPMLYRTICSKSIDRKMERLVPAAEWACRIVNDCPKDTLLMACLVVLAKMKSGEYVTQEEIDRWDNKELGDAVSYLVQQGVIEKNLIGEYRKIS